MLASAPPKAGVAYVLTPGEGLGLLIGLAGGVLIAGIVVWLARRSKDRQLASATAQAGQAGQLQATSGTPDTDKSLVRSWVAVSLVFGLLAFCAVAFLINDNSTRSTLVGGLVASAGTAIAFYFASKSSDQARSDLLQAATNLTQNTQKPTYFIHASPPAGTVQKDYQYTFAADGNPAATYWLAWGNLPDGLSLETNGSLHGSPSAANTWKFAVYAINSAGVLKSPDLSVTVS